MSTTAEPNYVPLDDPYDAEVMPVRRRPRLSVLTALLAFAAVAGAAFVGGVEIQKHYGGSSGGTGASAGIAAARGASARGRSAGGFGAATNGANFTSGLVTLIKGSTLYVTDFSGNTIKVKTAAGLQVSKTVASSVKAIHPGDSVVVRAAKQKDGSYVAISVSVDNTGGAAASGGLGAGGFGDRTRPGGSGAGFDAKPGG